MRSTLQFDASAAAIDIRYPAGEQYDCSRAGIAVGWHKSALELEQRAVELTLPSGLHKWQFADQIRRLRINSDFELVYLSADDNLRSRPLEFGAQYEGVTIPRDRRERCRVAQNRPTNEGESI